MNQTTLARCAAVLILFCMPVFGRQAAAPAVPGQAQAPNNKIQLQFMGIVPAVPGQARARDELIFLEKEWLNTNSPQVLNRILADGFVDVLPYGYLTKQQALERARQRRFAPSRFRRDLTGVNVRFFGGTGIVTGYATTANVEGQIVARTRFTHVYIYRDGRWQAVNAQEMPATARPLVRPRFP